MDWERAKNFCLLFLFLLNAFLFVSINIFGDKYKLDIDNKIAILDLLEKNNLKFDADLKKFSPKKNMSVVDYKFDFDSLKKIFLNFDVKNIRLNVFDKNGFDCDFELKKKLELKEIKKICDDIVAQINFLSEANFILDKRENNFVYYDRYDGFFLMDNFISINVSGNYEIKIKCRYKKINGFVGDKFEICSPDLVLYEFIKCDDVIKKEPKVINEF